MRLRGQMSPEDIKAFEDETLRKVDYDNARSRRYISLQRHNHASTAPVFEDLPPEPFSEEDSYERANEPPTADWDQGDSYISGFNYRDVIPEGTRFFSAQINTEFVYNDGVWCRLS